MSERLVPDRGTNEIPPEILARPDIYPNPKAYTYKVHIINGVRNIALFPILSDEEIIKRENAFKDCVADILMKHSDIINQLI